MKNILATGIFALLASNSIRFAADTATAAGGDGTATEAGTESAAPVAPISAADFLRNHPISEVVTLELKKIVVDAGTQPRVAISDETIDSYAEVIKTATKEQQPNPFDSLPDDNLPQVFRDPTGRCVLADGFHRYGAHKKAKAGEMRVAIRYGTERDALLFSLSTNKAHGVQRTNKDKQRAVKIALNDPEWSQWANTEIARICGVSEFMVRELRSAVKTPTQRKAVIRGKVTTVKTGAIGKGKGGGAKGAKAAAKAAKAAGKNGKGADTAAAGNGAADNTQELDALLRKIADGVGGEAGGAIRKAVHDGSLELSMPELRAWAGFAPKDIKNVAPLVTGGQRMKPTKAFDFIKSELSEKVVTELHNRAIGNGGTYEFKTDGVTITVKHTGKK